MASRLVHLLLIPALLLLRCEAGNVLYGYIGPMYPGEVLEYHDYVLMLQLDCDLVLYDKSAAVWSTKTKASSCSLNLKITGELVLSDGSGETLWSSNTTGSKEGNYVLVLQEDRDLVVYGPQLWHTNTTLPTPILPPLTPIDMDPEAKNVLTPRQILTPGDSLKNGKWELKLETNCNLVLYEDGDKIIWATNVTSKIEDGCYLRNNDIEGNVAVYDGSGKNIWTTGTSTPLSLLVLQSDRDLVLYGPAIWASNTIPSIHLHKNATTLPLLSA